MAASCVLGGRRFGSGAAVSLAMALGWLAAAVVADESGTGGSVFQDEPAAHALYDQMIEAMRKADTLSYVSHYQFGAKGQVYGDCIYHAWLKKPNFFRIEAEPAGLRALLSRASGGATGGILIGDGRMLWIHWPGGRPRFSVEEAEDYEKTRLTSYMKRPAPPGGHSIGHETGLLGAGMSMPVIDPSTFHGYSDSLQAYIDGVKSCGEEKIGEEDCDHIEVSIMKHQRSWHLWISRRDHLPRKMHQIVRVAYDITIDEEWSQVTVNADISDSNFVWSPPNGWTEWRMPRPEERLLKPGTEAPHFELASADGKPIRLSDYRGQVVWFYIWRAG